MVARMVTAPPVTVTTELLPIKALAVLLSVIVALAPVAPNKAPPAEP